jgi:putative flavoprotein involved in K+ transport
LARSAWGADTGCVNGARLGTSRNQPSLQLVGRPDHASIDLAVLHERGVRLAGRLAHVDGCRAHFADDLVATMAGADIKMATILMRIDQFIRHTGSSAPDADPFVPTWTLANDAVEQIDLRADRINTVIWATGYRRAYPWLQVPVLDADGELRHHAGVTPHPGLYVLGLNFQRRRNSSFIDGVGSDAQFLATHIATTRLQRHIA